MTEETNCYECDTPLTTICPQCNALSAAPSPERAEAALPPHLDNLHNRSTLGMTVAGSYTPSPPYPYQQFDPSGGSITYTSCPTLSEEDRARLEEVRDQHEDRDELFREEGYLFE